MTKLGTPIGAGPNGRDRRGRVAGGRRAAGAEGGAAADPADRGLHPGRRRRRGDAAAAAAAAAAVAEALVLDDLARLSAAAAVDRRRRPGRRVRSGRAGALRRRRGASAGARSAALRRPLRCRPVRCSRGLRGRRGRRRRRRARSSRRAAGRRRVAGRAGVCDSGAAAVVGFGAGHADAKRCRQREAGQRYDQCELVSHPRAPPTCRLGPKLPARRGVRNAKMAPPNKALIMVCSTHAEREDFSRFGCAG